MTTNTTPISPDLLEILRDPYAIQQGDQFGPDPGKLTLVNDYWLVSADTGYKYPIRDGIPVMLVDEGARWRDIPVEDLPVPPPSAAPERFDPAATAATSADANDTFNFVALAVVGGLLLVGGLIGLSWLRTRRQSSDPQ
ncbi:MAG: hypothetical protein R3C44_13270 [Chloroflexota bacterium]